MVSNDRRSRRVKFSYDADPLESSNETTICRTRQWFVASRPFFLPTEECVTPDGDNGVCIDLKTCEKLRTLMENRRHIDAVRVHLQKSFCGYAGRNPKVCCPAERPGQQVRPVATMAGAGPNRRTEPTSVLPAKNACGRPGLNRTNDDRIYGGVESKLGFSLSFVKKK